MMVFITNLLNRLPLWVVYILVGLLALTGYTHLIQRNIKQKQVAKNLKQSNDALIAYVKAGIEVDNMTDMDITMWIKNNKGWVADGF